MTGSDTTLLMGIDGGGTGCRAAISDANGTLLAEAKGGRANASTDFYLATQSVIDVATQALTAAKIEGAQLSRITAHVGLAGIMTQQAADRMRRALPFDHCVVTDDRTTALVGALGTGDGFLASIGTGTIMGAHQSDAYHFIGGWGFHLADQASGAWLGQNALRHVLLCVDGLQPASAMTDALLTQFGDDPNQIVHFSMNAKPGDYGKFAPLVVNLAKEQDPLALELMHRGAAYLTKGLKTLGYESGAALCLTGGVGPHYRPYLPNDMTTHVVQPKQSSVYGALELARSAAHSLSRGNV
ncbi:MAG: hypothetical protein JXR13_19215 [Thalassovita sp.]